MLNGSIVELKPTLSFKYLTLEWPEYPGLKQLGVVSLEMARRLQVAA